MLLVSSESCDAGSSFKLRAGVRAILSYGISRTPWHLDKPKCFWRKRPRGLPQPPSLLIGLGVASEVGRQRVAVINFFIF